MKLRFLALFALLAPAIASAQTLITYTATAQDSNYGYVSGQQYTFTFETSASFSDGTFSSSSDEWTGAALWTSVGGTGVNGTLLLPEGDTIFSAFWTSDYSLEAHVQDNSGNSINLTTPDGTLLGGIDAWVGVNSTAPYVSATAAADINSQLSTLIGLTFTSLGTAQGYGNYYVNLYDTNGSLIEGLVLGTVTFSSASAIPEPAQASAIAGCLALIAVFLYRRRKSAPARA